MEFDEVRLEPTYRLMWGIPGRSNALNIAQRVGVDLEVVAAARERLGAAEVRPTRRHRERATAARTLAATADTASELTC